MRSSKVSIGRTCVRYGFAFLVAAFAFLASVSIDFGGASSTFGSHESAKNASLVLFALNEAEAGKAKITAKAKKKKKNRSAKKKAKGKAKPSGKKAAKPKSKGKKQKPVLLGASMQRVNPAAAKMGYHTYQNKRTYQGRAVSDARAMRRQERWIKNQIRSGRKLYDIGMRRGAGPKDHKFYRKEREILKKYGYKRKMRGWITAKVDGKMRKFRKYEWVKE